MTVIKAATVTRLGRGGGVVTIPLITRQSAAEDNKITTGISIYPEGTGAPLHARPRGTDRSASPTRGLTETGFARAHPSRRGADACVPPELAPRTQLSVIWQLLAQRGLRV
jgi:hypothetical protein